MLTVGGEKKRRKFRREVPRERRSLVLEVESVGGEAIVRVREKGRRKGHDITVPRLFVILAERAASARKAKRAGRHRGFQP